MAFQGFGKDSGPSTTPRPQAPPVHFPRPPSPSPPHPRSPSDLNWGDLKASSIRNYDAQAYQRPPPLLPRLASGNPSTRSPAKTDQVQDSKRTRSPPSLFRADEISKNSRIFIEKPAFSSPVWVNQSKSQGNNSSSIDRESISAVWTKGGNYQSGRMSQTKPADVRLPKQIRSPTLPSFRGASPDYTFFPSDGHKRSPIDYRDLDAPEEMPSPPLAFESSFSKRNSLTSFTETENTISSSPLWANQLKSSSSNTTPVSREGLSPVSTTGSSYQSRLAFQTKHTDVPLPKRTRSPTLPSSSDSFSENPEFALDDYERAPDSQSHTESSKSGQSRQINNFEVPANNSLHFPVVKRAKLPLLPSSGQIFQENVDSAQEIERELHAKARRLARFKDELSQPVQNNSAFKNQMVPAKRQHQSEMEKHKSYEDPATDVTADLVGRSIVSDYEGAASSSSIVGLCPDMCPESERAERERKGDLDHYERLDGDRNLSSKFLAVKKYTRTAEREAELIRPMPILEKTMDYLLNLLDQPYNDGFLGLYNFLWDRMRAIRMDLRMQHIFNLRAISMLEQMIRLHILAMHELCEYTKGEGFSEGFDAHLNIEQMNKTSVELFQFYDDHRKKGIHVPSEKEFRGYYALLKLDKHPGYKVEPAELSLDLAKMTPEMRQTPEVLFAREVARACRTCNFIAFFRLARKASYLQACLMHAHFSKLRTQALASLNSGLQINQGIPVNIVAKWLGMEEEDIDDLLDYYGFSVKEFEEPYMVKESALISVDCEYPVKCSKLVARKQSKTIASDVLSPSLVDSHTTEELKVFQLKKDPEQEPTPLQFIAPGSIIRPSDQEMHESEANLSPKGNMPKPLNKTSIDLTSQGEQRTLYENQVVPASPLASDFCNSSSETHHIMVESAQKPKYDPVFRNSFGRAIKHDLAVTRQPITPERAEEKSPLILPIVSAGNAPIPQLMFAEQLEDEDQTGVMEEDDDAETSYYDQEVAEAKLKLVLRIWKRRTAKRKEMREHKRSEANAALSSLSLGPPIWQYKVQSDTYGVFNIDHVTSMRREIQGRSWSVLNPSDVVAAKLTEKNPDAKCLCWKMLLCSLDESAYGDNIGPSNESAYSWLQSKFMPASNNGDSNLLVSSPGLAIWKSWIPDQSGVDLICCLSVIKSTTFQDLKNEVTGASAVLFLLSENIPTELQKNWLDEVVMSLPSGSCLPLLILSGSGKDESDPSTIAKDLGLHDIDKSRVRVFSVSFLKDLQTKLDGFFSDKRLRGGLEWLASESPPQIIIHGIKTRELVISHLNSTLKVLDKMNAYRVDPNLCISSFNEALDRSMEEVVIAAHGNPTCWPCPEIDLLEESSYEYRAATWYLPSRGWSTAARIDILVRALNDSKLPIWEYDVSWLSRGFKISDDVKNRKLQLENCLVMYLTETSQMMGVAMAKKEASTVLQKCSQLELHNSMYHIVPSWVEIFRRVFSWRLMNLTSGEVSSTHVLVQRDNPTPTSEIPVKSEPKVHTLLPFYMDHPSFDELVEVCFNTLDLASIHTEHQTLQRLSPMAADDDSIPIFRENAVLMENENKEARNEATVTSYNHSTTVINNEGQLISSRPARESDKLSELLEKCNIVQNKIDKKLSIYF